MAGNPNLRTCLRCGHTWLSLLARPVVCPKCKSYQWDKPRLVKQTASTAVVKAVGLVR